MFSDPSLLLCHRARRAKRILPVHTTRAITFYVCLVYTFFTVLYFDKYLLIDLHQQKFQNFQEVSNALEFYLHLCTELGQNRFLLLYTFKKKEIKKCDFYCYLVFLKRL